nr:MAG TPA: hypothetical protein [Caudoviricetes sp.]
MVRWQLVYRRSSDVQIFKIKRRSIGAAAPCNG